MSKQKFHFRIVLELQKSCEDSTEFLYKPDSVSPIVSITRVYLSQLNNVDTLLLKSIFYSNLFSFQPNVFFFFFCSAPGSHAGCHMTFSKSSVLSSQFLRLSLFVMTLKILMITGYIFCRKFFIWSLSDAFLIITQEL